MNIVKMKLWLTTGSNKQQLNIAAKKEELVLQ